MKSARNYQVFQRKQLDRLPQVQGLSADVREAIEVVSAVLPFRVNNYVVDELIDWSRVPDDPMFQLTFPQRGMLGEEDYERMRALIASGADNKAIKALAQEIQTGLNPHPGGQLEKNVPSLGGEPMRGMQHKYRQTLLFFPAQGQTCHSYCTYCFRWAQFVGIEDLKFFEKEAEPLLRYLQKHPEVSDVLFTGGDPLVMRTPILSRYIDMLLDANLDSLRTIRIGSKAPAYWPQRFVTDPDADDLLRLFERVVASGRHLALMAHYTHPHELETDIAKEALRRIVATGATVRCQAPLIRHVNDRPEDWARLWQMQVELGAVPYYMFVERDTGAHHYFELPLAEAYQIFSEAYCRVSGLARTVRGPSMSANPGKMCIDGVAEIAGEYDEKAVWLDDLKPAFGEKHFFWERPEEDIRHDPASQMHRIWAAEA
ncbi:MAG: KamA family radical SAM protein [Planctomycetota bacterium]